MTALAALWDAIDPLYIGSTAHLAGHLTLNITAAAFELNLVKGHTEALAAILIGAATIVEVDIAEAFIIGFLANGLAASTNGLAFQLFHFTAGLAPLVDAISIAAIVSTV